jgi:hypothetical protein
VALNRSPDLSCFSKEILKFNRHLEKIVFT